MLGVGENQAKNSASTKKYPEDNMATFLGSFQDPRRKALRFTLAEI